VVICDTDIQ